MKALLYRLKFTPRTIISSARIFHSLSLFAFSLSKPILQPNNATFATKHHDGKLSFVTAKSNPIVHDGGIDI